MSKRQTYLATNPENGFLFRFQSTSIDNAQLWANENLYPLNTWIVSSLPVEQPEEKPKRKTMRELYGHVQNHNTFRTLCDLHAMEFPEAMPLRMSDSATPLAL